MWDSRRKVGVLSGFGSARFADQKDAGGRGARGAMPFLAMDLLQPKDEDECQVLRLYRHDAESFAWCLFYLCFTIIEENGKNYSKDPNPLGSWLTGRQDCHLARRVIWGMRDLSEYSDPSLAFPNTKDLVCHLDGYWDDLNTWKMFDRYRQLRKEWGMKTDPISDPLPYEELDEESVFMKLVEIHRVVLDSNEALGGVRERFTWMCREYQEVDWTN